MSDYTPTEIVDMIMILGETQNNFAAAARLYAQRFPNRRHPNRVSIRDLAERAREGRMTRERPHHEYDENDARAITVLALVHMNPHISSRQIQRETGICRSVVLKILKATKYYAYHIALTQALTPADMVARVQFCQWALRKIQCNNQFFRYVLFSDEATFESTGHLNRHNSHYWSDVNPRWHRSIDNQHRWSVMVWCGIVNGYLIGPYFFDDNVTAASYLQFLRNDLFNLMENVDLGTRQRMWFQQDGAPPHFARIVRDHLNEQYPNRWIGRGGPFQWPPRSPDLTSLDFYLWGMLKDCVYAQRPTTRDDMKERIRTACAAIPRTVLLQTVDNFHKRLNLCLQENGDNFEQHLRC